MSKKVRDQLVEEHLDYAKKLANNVLKELGHPETLDLNEVMAYAYQGLVEAADRYDPTKGAAFTTYSYYRIRGAIYDGMRKSGWLPRSYLAKYQAGANELLNNESEREKNKSAAGSIEDQIQDFANTINDLATIYLTSMDGSDGQQFAAKQDDIDKKIDNKTAAKKVMKALKELPDKERKLIELHYFEDLSLLDAGKRIGASKSWASRLHARAIRMLSMKLAESFP